MLKLPNIKLPLSVNHVKYFPHITRIFSAIFQPASITSGTLTLLLIFITTNSILPNKKLTDPNAQLRIETMSHPINPFVHEKLAQSYLKINSEAAKHEFALAQELYSGSGEQAGEVLGVQTLPWQKWLNLLNQRVNLTKEATYWDKISQTYPDYRYAKLKLAVINYQLGDINKASFYLNWLIKETPNDSIVLDLKDKFSL